jgi:hypothetical protein
MMEGRYVVTAVRNGEAHEYGRADDLTGANKLILAALTAGYVHAYQQDIAPDTVEETVTGSGMTPKTFG